MGTFIYNLRFPGQYFQTETGPSYNYFRDYDPVTGRYIESDPIGLSGGINTYVYVGFNPINRIDRRGLYGDLAGDEARGWQAVGQFGLDNPRLFALGSVGSLLAPVAAIAAFGSTAEAGSLAEGAASTWDTTIPQTGEYLNVGTNVTATEFQANLISNGFNVVQEGVSSNGAFTVLSNGETTYTIYTASSTGQASVQVFDALGETLLKYRLGRP